MIDAARRQAGAGGKAGRPGSDDRNVGAPHGVLLVRMGARRRRTLHVPQNACPGADPGQQAVLRKRTGADRRPQAFTETWTGMPLVRTSYTAERARDCSTISRSFSGGASPSISNVTRTF